MRTRVAVGALLLLVAGACAPAVIPADSPAPVSAGPVPFRVLASGQIAQYDRSDAAIAVLADPPGLNQWWTRHVGVSMPPDAVAGVSFAQEIVVVVLLGRRNTGGYSIEVREVWLEGSTVKIVVELKGPPPRALVPQVISSPYQLIAINAVVSPQVRQLHYVMQSADGTVIAETDPVTSVP